MREPRGGDHKIARRGLLVKSAADRLEGLEGVEVRLGMVEDGSLEKVQVVEGEGVDHAASGVEPCPG